jgi:hypothetical protein
MENELTTVYVICEDVLSILGIHDDPQAIMSNAEIITFSIFAARDFAGNHKKARWYFKRLGFFPKILSNSRLNRRLHKISWEAWNAIFRFLALIFIKDSSSTFAVDSFPVPCCQKSRIDRRKIFIGKEYIGYAASKKRHFCGLKVHMIVTTEGKPVECLFRAASENDISVFWKMELDLPVMSTIYADGAYNCFELEDILKEDENIQLLAKRGSKIKNRRRPQSEEKVISSKRQIVETAFSCITSFLPRSFRVKTENGLKLRLLSAILAYSFSFLY